MLTHRWHALSESQYPWERDALQYLRERLPDSEPIRVWANAEFLSLDGRLNEVDAIVLTSKGLFLVEIKSRPGEVSGDQQRWVWKDGASQFDIDNPLRLANLKSKRLADLLAHKRVVGSARLPFIEPLIFCSAPGVRLKLPTPLDQRVFAREPGDGGIGRAPGIVKALTLPAVGPSQHSGVDGNMARIVTRAMDEAGLRASIKAEQVGDYKLGALIGEGPTFQDYEATHVALNVRRRVRLYPIPLGAPAELRQTVLRAAQREFQILEGVEHPGIPRAHEYRETERGPALIFAHDPQAIRLDQFLAANVQRLDDTLRLHLLRAIGEVVQHAHKKHLFHRALSPQSVFVADPDRPEPGIVILNWQAGTRHGGTTSGVGVSGTAHIDALIEDAAQIYVAPEARLGIGEFEEGLDVFSLGAIAYHVFTGAPPADSLITLQDKLRTQDGLLVSDRVNAPPVSLVDLVKQSTRPQVTLRLRSVEDFLSGLELVEEELTRPEQPAATNPVDAQKGDIIAGGLKVLKRLGKGSTAVALLVERDRREYVLKVALSLEHNARLRAEGEVLSRIRHTYVVAFHEEIEAAGHVCLLLDKAGETTLAKRLREDGPLHLDWLERFGEDLLGVVDHLEETGVSHRDIKPENLGIVPVGRGDRQHLVLYDFSLARESPENIRSGTVAYLDPFLKLRTPPRWDLDAERFAVAMTLYEMATGQLPRWGDGASDPALVQDEVTLEAELFDANLRDALGDFFRQALARDPRKRFDNARAMLKRWREVFARVGRPAVVAPDDETADAGMAEVFAAALATATLDTPLVQLGVSTRAANALERLGCSTVRQLVPLSLGTVWGLPGVGHKTRREIATMASALKARFQDVPPSAPEDDGGEQEGAAASLEVLAARLVPRKVSGGKGEEKILLAVLALGAESEAVSPFEWPSQMAVSKRSGLTRARVSQVLVKTRERWRRDPLFTRLRRDIAEIVETQGGVMEASELTAAVLSVRGSAQPEPLRTRQAAAVVRAAVEVELAQQQPRLVLQRTEHTAIVARDDAAADWAQRLGDCATALGNRDPLASPDTALAALQETDQPEGVRLPSSARLLRLATAVSGVTAVSIRQEIYPRGMSAVRALKLSKSLLPSRGMLSIEQLRERVASRYPEAEPLPARPALDALLTEAGFDFLWNGEALDGQGAYTSRDTLQVQVPSPTSTLTRYSTRPGQPTIAEDGDVLDARAFEERLRYAVSSGQFLALTAGPRDLRRAEQELQRFGVAPLDLDAVIVRAMKEAALAAGASWDIVRRADAAGPRSADWNNLLVLVRRTMPAVTRALSPSGLTPLVTNLGLLARYTQLGVLSEVRNAIGQPDGPKGLWLLVPSTGLAPLPVVDGHAIPVITPAQWARIPEPWLRNVHRAA